MPTCGGRAATACVVHHTKEREVRAQRRGPTADASSSLTTVSPPVGAATLLRRACSVFDPLWVYQPRCLRFYQHKRVQYFIAALISANFLINIIESQIDPFGTMDDARVDAGLPSVWGNSEDVFNIIFLIELLLNAYANWCIPFWTSGWNMFDVLVVAVGMISVARVPLPGPLGLLRMLRAFRVFRLFKRIKSLNRIVMSLIAAVPGITNAAFIMFLVMCIYSILGVEFFASFAESGVYNNSDLQSVEAISNRELKYGDEYFGTFAAALLTMFQVLTGESWAEAVARPLVFQENILYRAGSAVFFITYILLNAVVLINVVVAVLLEKCIAPEEPDPPPPAEEVESMALKSIQDAMLLNKPSLHLDRIGERHLPAPAPAEEALAASLVAEVSALSAQVAVLLRAVQAQAAQIHQMSAETAMARAPRERLSAAVS